MSDALKFALEIIGGVTAIYAVFWLIGHIATWVIDTNDLGRQLNETDESLMRLWKRVEDSERRATEKKGNRK